MVSLVKKYYDIVVELLTQVLRDEQENIDKASTVVAEALENDKIIHVVGAGHSAMVGEEMFYRAGGLAAIDPILDNDITVHHGSLKSTAMEHIVGYAEILLKHHGVSAGDVVIVVSTSGVNQFPVEAAIKSSEMGAKTIGITSVKYSSQLEPKNKFGKRLYEVVDVVIDNHVPRGDAVLEVEGFSTRVAPVSTILNTFIVNSIVAETIRKLVEKGVEPPVWISSHLPGADEYNRALYEKYRSRIKLL
ncbi:SIS domain-containing protein [Desulfurococcaceae archaeon MEX13E-LK6-19]|nr:SIS domain-containing protein [Desulfurococcaceae archaeon MEX13E-LK6-19]